MHTQTFFFSPLFLCVVFFWPLFYLYRTCFVVYLIEVFGVNKRLQNFVMYSIDVRLNGFWRLNIEQQHNKSGLSGEFHFRRMFLSRTTTAKNAGLTPTIKVQSRWQIFSFLHILFQSIFFRNAQRLQEWQ